MEGNVSVQSVLEAYKNELANANHDKLILQAQLKEAREEIARLTEEAGENG